MQRSNSVKFSVAAILLVLGLIVVAIAIAFIFYRHKLDGSEPLPGLSGNVEVYFDDYGIPHIYADDAADAYRAFGYVHARDRLFQMELMRRVGRGRLSEVFGGEFLKTDMFFRTLGTHR